MRLLLPILIAISSPAPSHAREPDPKTETTLAGTAQLAASAIVENQAAGFWLTTYTSSTRYEQPTPELNTFTNAFLVDLVDPIAKEAQLGGAVARAREFLSSQIEENGLVRYHGRPGAWANRGFCVCTIT